jgi:hypothetical protein
MRDVLGKVRRADQPAVEADLQAAMNAKTSPGTFGRPPFRAKHQRKGQAGRRQLGRGLGSNRDVASAVGAEGKDGVIDGRQIAAGISNSVVTTFGPHNHPRRRLLQSPSGCGATDSGVARGRGGLPRPDHPRRHGSFRWRAASACSRCCSIPPAPPSFRCRGSWTTQRPLEVWGLRGVSRVSASRRI